MRVTQIESTPRRLFSYNSGPLIRRNRNIVLPKEKTQPCTHTAPGPAFYSTHLGQSIRGPHYSPSPGWKFDRQRKPLLQCTTRVPSFVSQFHSFGPFFYDGVADAKRCLWRDVIMNVWENVPILLQGFFSFFWAMRNACKFTHDQNVCSKKRSLWLGFSFQHPMPSVRVINFYAMRRFICVFFYRLISSETNVFAFSFLGNVTHPNATALWKGKFTASAHKPTFVIFFVAFHFASNLTHVAYNDY